MINERCILQYRAIGMMIAQRDSLVANIEKIDKALNSTEAQLYIKQQPSGCLFEPLTDGISCAEALDVLKIKMLSNIDNIDEIILDKQQFINEHLNDGNKASDNHA